MKELMKAQWEAARKKAQMQESVANVYDTNIRTFSKSITGGNVSLEKVIFHIDVNSAFLSWEAVYRLHHRAWAGHPSV